MLSALKKKAVDQMCELTVLMSPCEIVHAEEAGDGMEEEINGMNWGEGRAGFERSRANEKSICM